jgi:GT2 family glycosyltransferase
VHNRDEKENVGPWCLTINVWEERGFYETCNIGYRREWLERCGGFDESFIYCGEDADLAWRAKEQGAKSTFAEDALVRHAVWPSEYRRYFRSLRRNRGMVPLVARHPQLRAQFPRPWLYKTSHAWAVAVGATSLVALARPRRPWLWIPALVCADGYRRAAVETRHRPRERRDIPLWVLQGLAADGYEVATMLAASVRYRSFLI